MTALTQQLARPAVRRRLFVGLAFLLQGLWAAYVARHHGGGAMLRSGLLHGGLCAAMTTVSTLLMDFFFNQARSPLIGLLYAVLGTTAVMLSGALAVHLINRTPDIPRTIAPLVILGVPFYILYSTLIYKTKKTTGERP